MKLNQLRSPLTMLRLRELHESLDRRYRPEDVARIVLDILQGHLSKKEERTLRRAANHANRYAWFGGSSMTNDFARPVGMKRQLEVAGELFDTDAIPPERDDDAEAIKDYLITAERTIAKDFGQNDFIANRMNKSAREAAGMDISKRRYNKLFRLAARMERKRERMMREQEKRAFTLISKSRLACSVAWDEFAADVDSACFIAYFTARCNLRSEFTIYGQQKPYDEMADVLFDRCRRAQGANWWAVAKVFPDREVLAKLDDERRGQLLASWFGVLDRIAGFLRDLWKENDFNRETMIVRRGNDSTTWNTIAGAWNKARDGWISLLYAMEMDGVVERMCPGKVLRLMAADVAAWHRSTGGNLDRDTLVWNEVPLPWKVLSGDAECRRDDVEMVCRKHRVNPVKSGWIAPRPGRTVQRFRPTPELVHGVTVEHPQLALLLRKMGVFSGKKLKVPNTHGNPQRK